MEKRRRGRNRSGNNQQKSGAERAEYQLFLDVRQFMQQIQGFLNGLQRDEKIDLEKMRKEQQEQEQKTKSSIIQIKKRIKPIKTQYTTNNLSSWANFQKFVQQFQ